MPDLLPFDPPLIAPLPPGDAPALIAPAPAPRPVTIRAPSGPLIAPAPDPQP